MKNINSFKFIEKAIEYEIARHIAVIEGGGRIIQDRGDPATLCQGAGLGGVCASSRPAPLQTEVYWST